MHLHNFVVPETDDPAAPAPAAAAVAVPEPTAHPTLPLAALSADGDEPMIVDAVVPPPPAHAKRPGAARLLFAEPPSSPSNPDPAQALDMGLETTTTTTAAPAAEAVDTETAMLVDEPAPTDFPTPAAAVFGTPRLASALVRAQRQTDGILWPLLTVTRATRAAVELAWRRDLVLANPWALHGFLATVFSPGKDEDATDAARARVAAETRRIDLVRLRTFAFLASAAAAARDGRFVLSYAQPLVQSLLGMASGVRELRMDLAVAPSAMQLADALDGMPGLRSLHLRDNSPGGTTVAGRLVYSIFGHASLRDVDLHHVRVMHTLETHAKLAIRNHPRKIDRSRVERLRFATRRFSKVPGQPDALDSLMFLIRSLPRLAHLAIVSTNYPAPLLDCVAARAPALQHLELEFGHRLEWPTCWLRPEYAADPTYAPGMVAMPGSKWQYDSDDDEEAVVAEAAGAPAPRPKPTQWTAPALPSTPFAVTRMTVHTACGLPDNFDVFLAQFPRLERIALTSINAADLPGTVLYHLPRLTHLSLHGVDVTPAPTALLSRHAGYAPLVSLDLAAPGISPVSAVQVMALTARLPRTLESLRLGPLAVPSGARVGTSLDDLLVPRTCAVPAWLVAWILRTQPRIKALALPVANGRTELGMALAALPAHPVKVAVRLTVAACGAPRYTAAHAASCTCLPRDEVRAMAARVGGSVSVVVEQVAGCGWLPPSGGSSTVVVEEPHPDPEPMPATALVQSNDASTALLAAPRKRKRVASLTGGSSTTTSVTTSYHRQAKRPAAATINASAETTPPRVVLTSAAWDAVTAATFPLPPSPPPAPLLAVSAGARRMPVVVPGRRCRRVAFSGEDVVHAVATWIKDVDGDADADADDVEVEDEVDVEVEDDGEEAVEAAEEGAENDV
ncbi:hypothetical protein H9P43_008471 [Blastocladiella emersonii ATCC 22665]|nr:hypothetical protein H9P43_008471 [Blastocladiella emersonii ATCC 22665]